MKIFRPLIPASILALALAGVFCAPGRLAAQTPPPPPPTSESGDKEMRGVPGNFDLSQVPIPAADRKEHEPELTSDERKAGVVMLAVAPLGYVPKPIIYIDKSGMPRERYRNPLEFPPSIYHIKTAKGTIRVLSGQNRIGPFTPVPKLRQLDLSFEIPPDPDTQAPDDDKKKGPHLRRLGTITVGAATTHLLVVVWKQPTKKLWSAPQWRVLDVSPIRSKPNLAWVINLTPHELILQTGKAPERISGSFVGRVSLPVNQRGDLRLIVAARIGKESFELSDTILRPYESDRLFLLAWPEPRTNANPSGVGFVPLLKDLPPPEGQPQ